jgi:5-deoxy-D-glucuronate isomerase
MHPHLIRNPDGFPADAYTDITNIGENQADTGIELGILRMPAGRRLRTTAVREGALLLLEGELTFVLPHPEGRALVGRESLFVDDEPVCLHYPKGFPLDLEALSDVELAYVGVENDTPFEARLFDGSNMLDNEQRGKGQLDDTAHRVVRTIFDIRNRPQCKLVLGEVVNFPGRWSSYPPHHHPQPELYHYRFDRPQRYGHGELGDEVLKIRQYDTLKILEGRDHSQCAAPGYAMWYLWAIRHLPGKPYTVPEFTAEHRWMM